MSPVQRARGGHNLGGSEAKADEPTSDGRILVRRHALFVRVSHWLNVLFMTVLLFSGLQIFNAHPALYWGPQSTFAHPALAIDATQAPNGEPIGYLQIGKAVFHTTGVLGVSSQAGQPQARAFPAWLTLPAQQDLATGRRWHFFFAWLFVFNGAAYLAWTIFSGHVRRDLWPTRSDLAHIGRSIAEHVRLRFPKGEEARHYNVLQKLAYVLVIFVLAPLMLVTGLTMSPGMDAQAPWLLVLLGGRQSARAIHFITASSLVLFVFVHVTMVFLAGFWNEIRSMITGRYAIEADGKPQP